MLSNTDALVAILDYVARGAVLVVIWMLRQLFLLDKRFHLLDQEQQHQRQMAELESSKRDSQRREILAAIEKHGDKLEAHNDGVMRELRKIVGSSGRG